MNRLLIGKFCLVMVMLQLICFLFVTNFMVKDEISDRKPFFAQIDEIAVSDSNVYTLDSTFKKICKYDLNGKFLYTISFSTTGEGGGSFFSRGMDVDVILWNDILKIGCDTIIVNIGSDKKLDIDEIKL